MFTDISLFRKILTSEKIFNIIQDVFENDPTYINHSKISFKFSDQRVWYPHQDVAYKQNKVSKGITVCVHLDKVLAENGALVCYDGSHKNGFVDHGFDETETDPQLRASNYSNYKKTILEGNIGDILYFDFNTIHSSEGNTKEGCRPIFIFEVKN